MSEKSPHTMEPPKHVISISFIHYGKTYNITCKIFNDDKTLNTYFRKVSKTYTAGGVYAGAIFNKPGKKNKYNVGEIVFSLDNLHPSLIAHEATHLVFNYYEFSPGGLDFKTRRREEAFCAILETIIDSTYEYILNNNIPFTMLPKYRNIECIQPHLTSVSSVSCTDESIECC